MKVFFDTNVYIAEALLGGGAEQMLNATVRIRWRVLCSQHVLDEIERVIVNHLRFSRRFGILTRQRARRRANMVVPPASRHEVPHDPADSPILRAALAAGADLLVTNDAHLLGLNPYQGLRIISMTDYFQLLVNEGYIDR
jgi:putative PIN family toxin of toxin-antitoxin system